MPAAGLSARLTGGQGIKPAHTPALDTGERGMSWWPEKWGTRHHWSEEATACRHLVQSCVQLIRRARS
jgi:hypothetical protein